LREIHARFNRPLRNESAKLQLPATTCNYLQLSGSKAPIVAPCCTHNCTLVAIFPINNCQLSIINCFPLFPLQNVKEQSPARRAIAQRRRRRLRHPNQPRLDGNANAFIHKEAAVICHEVVASAPVKFFFLSAFNRV
jgi:hypothetical protein